jgi:hypothetical protein
MLTGTLHGLELTGLIAMRMTRSQPFSVESSLSKRTHVPDPKMVGNMFKRRETNRQIQNVI